MTFDELGLHPKVLKAVELSGYTVATPVQAQAIPAALAGSDLLVSSQTGSGKTAAFMLPCLHRLASAPGSRQPRMLVLTPTRELAAQVTRSADTYGKFLDQLRYVSIVGGSSMFLEMRKLKGRVDVIVATPGRLLDHLRRRSIDLSRLEVVVLDEADRMLDMGFIEDIETIIGHAPATRQTMLFSATLDGVVGKLAQRVTRDALRIEIASVQSEKPRIDQQMMFADSMHHKSKLLDAILRDTSLQQAVVFTSTKRTADQLSESLREQGHAVEALHGDMNQGARNRALQAMRQGRLRVLVATDVAARGLDVPGISHVINFDLPKQAEDYVHRIGRTGRAGREGTAISFANHQEHGLVRNIERYTTQQIPVSVIAGLEPKLKATFRPAPKSGARRGGPGGSGGPARKPGFASARRPSTGTQAPRYR